MSATACARPLLFCLVLALVAACDGGSVSAPATPSGPPAVRDVTPAQVSNDREAFLLLSGAGFRPGLRIAVGPLLVGRDIPGKVTYINETLAAVTVAAGLQPGDYDVGITNLNGDFAKLDRVLKVRAAEPPPAPSPTATPSPSPTPTASPTPTPSPSPSATATPRPSLSPVPSPTPSPAPSPTPPPPTRTPSPALTPAPTRPPNPTATATPSPAFNPAPPNPTPPRPTIPVPGTLTPAPAGTRTP